MMTLTVIQTLKWMRQVKHGQAALLKGTCHVDLKEFVSIEQFSVMGRVFNLFGHQLPPKSSKIDVLIKIFNFWLHYPIWIYIEGFPRITSKWMVYKFLMENPIKMDDLGVPLSWKP